MSNNLPTPLADWAASVVRDALFDEAVEDKLDLQDPRKLAKVYQSQTELIKE